MKAQIKERVNQNNHAFVVGDLLFLNGSSYSKASASSSTTAEVVGIVSKVTSLNAFELTLLVGEMSGLSASNFDGGALPAAGSVIFLSTNAGKLTTTEPSVVGQVSLPVGVMSSSTSIFFKPSRGVVAGGATAMTQTGTSFYVGGDVDTWYPVVFNRDGGGADFDFKITRDFNQTNPASGFCNFRFRGSLAAGAQSSAYSEFSIDQTLVDTPTYNIDNDIYSYGTVGGYLADPYGNRITVWLRGSRDYYLNSYSGNVALETIIYSTSSTSFSYSGGVYTVYSGFKLKTFNDWDTVFVYLHDQNNISGIAVINTLMTYASHKFFSGINFSNGAITGSSINSTSINSNSINSNSIVANGSISTSGIIFASSGGIFSNGYRTRTGTGAGPNYGQNYFNIYWTGSVPRLYIDNTNVGQIALTSDYRVKKNIETQDSSALDRIAKIRPVKYELADYKELFRADGVQREGFIAHELQEVVPSAVDGEKDAEDQIQSLKLDALCSVMVKAIQEQQALINALKAEVELLKNK